MHAVCAVQSTDAIQIWSVWTQYEQFRRLMPDKFGRCGLQAPDTDQIGSAWTQYAQCRRLIPTRFGWYGSSMHSSGDLYRPNLVGMDAVRAVQATDTEQIWTVSSQYAQLGRLILNKFGWYGSKMRSSGN